MRLKWLRDKDMNIELDLFSEICNMSYYSVADDIIEERGFVGNLTRYIKHKLQGDDGKLELDKTFF